MSIEPGKYTIEWSAEVSGTSVIEILPEDIDGSDDLEDAALRAVEEHSYPFSDTNYWDSFEIYNVSRKRELARIGHGDDGESAK